MGPVVRPQRLRGDGAPLWNRCIVKTMADRRAVAWGVWAVSPVALALLVMLPRLASPQFGLLDNGLTLRIGREIVGTWWPAFHLIPETGRFFPAYWLAYSAIFGIVGARPLAFFVVNLLLFAGLLALLGFMVRLGGGTRLHAALAAGLLALSGPAIETFYTLSKAEPLQMMWVALSLLAAAAAATRRQWARLGLTGLAAAFLVVAHGTKETSVVLLPISVGWLGIERWVSRQRGTYAPFAVSYVAANVIAVLAFLGLRSYFAPLRLSDGLYTRAYALSAPTVGAALFRMAAWVLRSFAFLLPLLGVAGLTVIRGRGTSRRLILYAGVWMGGWLAVFLPWPATFAYYLLPFALGAAVLGSAVIGDLAHADGHAPLVRRTTAWGVLAATTILWLVTVANAVTDARVQLAVDRANADLVDFLATLPTQSRVVLNTAQPNEYLFELPLHLSEIKRRPDIVVKPIVRPWPQGPAASPVFVATPDVTNRPVPTVRVAIDEFDTRSVNATLHALLSGRGELVHGSGQRAPLFELGIHRLLCFVSVAPLVDPAYCPGDRGLVYWRTFAYGWHVHRLARPGPDGG
jgi:hypothetical protein